ncbi:MAG: xanthine dehydrogenase family protein subunit M [Clostridia bacterium]
MNTKILENEFAYIKPTTLESALSILATREKVKVFAGGTDLIVKLKVGAPIAMDTMLDINGIGELFGITSKADGVTIGAAEKISVIENNGDIKNRFIGVYEALKAMASISVRNMATLGGNFCNASPVADATTAILAYDGSVELKKKDAIRTVRAEEFFLAPGVTVMEQDELLTAVHLPAPKENTGATFIKLSRVKSDIAKISICVVLHRDGNRISSCRITMGAVAARPLYLKEISESLADKVMTLALINETAVKISKFIRPIDDNRTTAEYRTDVAKVIAEDAIEETWKRSGGELQ